MSPQAQIIIMAVCLLMSAYFSATETAFSTLSKTKLKTMIDKGNKRASLALKLSENYDRLISTSLIGSNLVNILLSSIATVFVITLCTNAKDQTFADSYGTLISTIVDFIILAFAVFCMVKFLNSLHRKKEEAPAEEPAPPEPSAEEKLLTEIRDLLKEKN